MKNSITYDLEHSRDTVNTHVFTRGSREDRDLMTIYVRKSEMKAAGMDPAKGITITIQERSAE
jgi:hypothetical protein